MSPKTESLTAAQAAARPVAAAFNQGQVPTIACVNLASDPLGVDWAKLVQVLDEYANVFAKVWGTPAHVIAAPDGKSIPAGDWGLVFLDNADQPNALGYHDLTQDGLPLSKIFVRTTTQDGQKVSVTATHELAEMLVDPGIQMGAIGPDGHTWYAYETADAVEQEEFQIQGVAVSNFVYPAWFEGFRKPNSTKFDHLDGCTEAFELRPGGYMPVYRNGQWTQIFGSKQAETRFKLQRHPRVEQRGRVFRHHSIK
jgi:hypothetical protein